MNAVEWAEKIEDKLRTKLRVEAGEIPTIEDARTAACFSALTEWRRTIRDTDNGHEADAEAIAYYFRTCGWQWYLDAYGGGTYVETYEVEVNGETVVRFMEWCGVFAGSAWRTAGAVLGSCSFVGGGFMRLDYALAYYILPGTPRFKPSGSRWVAAREEKSYRGEPFKDVSEPWRGDILTVGKGQWGSHIVLCLDRIGDKVLCIEGNGRGHFPNGERGEGVVVVIRDISEVVRCWRVETQHLSGA